MKLRNKKTGEVMGISMAGDIIWVGNYRYESLTELNTEWEDYTYQEPLIKDEKIRKAVRAWGYSPLTFKQHRRKGYCQFWYLDKYICFRDEFEGLKDRKLYTITELCGEEE